MIGGIPLDRAAAIMRDVVRIVRRERAQAERRQQRPLDEIDDAAGQIALQHRIGQAADGEDLVRADTRSRSLRPDDRRRRHRTGRHCPDWESARGRRRAPRDAVAAQRFDQRPAMRSALIQSAWISTGLPMRGVTTRSPILASIQVSCSPGLAGANEPVGVERDAVARALPQSRRGSPARLAPASPRPAAGAGRGCRPQELLDGDHEPERRIDRVVLGRSVALAEPVGQHSLVDLAGPGQTEWRPPLPGGPVASSKPRIAMNVSRPQSVNQGKPATIVVPRLPSTT